MTNIYKLKDNTTIGYQHNLVLDCDLTEVEWERIDKEQEVYGDDLSYFKTLTEFKEKFITVPYTWVWSTAHSINERARSIEESRWYDRDDHIGDMMYEQAEYLRDRAKIAVKESLKLIKS
tara:strand:+ start:260 stop:619 length:360 start_codon:yes stop_codon:yes gene_type:complete